MSRLISSSIFLLFCIALTLFQTGFIAGLGPPFLAVNMPLFLTLFTVSVFNERYAFLLFGISTTLTGLISSSYLLTPLAVGFITCIILAELHERFFTNRTYYSVLTMGGIGLALYSSMLVAWTNAVRFILHAEAFYIRTPSLRDSIVAIVVFWAILTLCYLATTLVSKRIRSYFIVAGRL